MVRPLTKAQARVFRDRWRLVNAREEEEMRETSMDLKLQQFNTLLAWSYQLGWTDALGKGEEEVRARWAKLRKAHRG